MEITRKLYEPNITLRHRVFLKDVSYTLTKKERITFRNKEDVP